MAVAGLPNAGKSTLINAFIEGQPLITSWRPQTTRFHIRCICSSPTRQIIFVDTPGWHRQKGRLEQFMLDEIARGLDGVDVIVYLVDASTPRPELNVKVWKQACELASGVRRRVLVLSKADTLPREDLLPLMQRFHDECSPDDIVPVSARKRENLDCLDQVLTLALPEGPRFYPEDILVDRPDDFVFAEFIREQLHCLTHDEVPFSIAVEVDSIKRSPKRIDVEATVYVERDSQKGIVIGSGGKLVRDIRRKATVRIARFTGTEVTLSLFVKVAENWTEKASRLSYMGYR